MIRFDISNIGREAVNVRLLKQCVSVFAKAAKISSPRYFSLAFVDGRSIRKLNRMYRGKDKVTDVLSFAERDSGFGAPDEDKELGEIIICLPQAVRQAKENHWSRDYEICRLLVHGLAHLVGYEHECVSRRTADKMVKFEQSVMDRMHFRA